MAAAGAAAPDYEAAGQAEKDEAGDDDYGESQTLIGAAEESG